MLPPKTLEFKKLENLKTLKSAQISIVISLMYKDERLATEKKH